MTVTSSSGQTVSFINIQASHTITATFAQITWQILVTQSANGLINPVTTSYAQGSSITETVTPDSGYYIASITVDGNPIIVNSSGGQTVNFNNVQASHTITATFAQITWQITVTQSSNGLISPSTSSYAQGSNPGETITPANGYYIASITVDGNPVTVTSSGGQTVNFNNIQMAHTISATFSATNGITYQNYVSWSWGDTKAASIATADINGDGQSEIVTGGSYTSNGQQYAQLMVWNSQTLALEKSACWLTMGGTKITSVAIGDVNGDGKLEIVTGGSYFDGILWNAQLIVWDASSLTLLKTVHWYWTSDTEIHSVAVGNITGNVGLDIVTGGAYYDGTRWVAQLTTWNGVTLAAEKVSCWCWASDTYINSVAVGNVTGGSTLDIVTGGSFNDGTRDNAQLLVWNGATLTIEHYISWYWYSNTEVNAVAIAQTSSGTTIVSGGEFNDGTTSYAQLITWNSALAVENSVNWCTFANTVINSVAIKYNGANSFDIITAGSFINGGQNYAQLVDFNGQSLNSNLSESWSTVSNTEANSVVVSSSNQVVVADSWYDNTWYNARLTTWV